MKPILTLHKELDCYAKGIRDVIDWNYEQFWKDRRKTTFIAKIEAYRRVVEDLEFMLRRHEDG